MRVCINTKTGKMIESQSGGDALHPHRINPEWTDAEFIAATDAYRQASLDMMIKNAINAGHKAEDVEVKFVTDAEFEALMEAARPEPTQKDLNKKKIDTEIQLMAIERLKVKDPVNFPADYRIPFDSSLDWNSSQE